MLIPCIQYQFYKNTNQQDLTYLCRDNRIHLRLRDFNQECIIQGFEQKLLYLIEYFIHFSLENVNNFSEATRQLNEYEDMTIVQRTIASYIFSHGLQYRGIKIKENYKRSECNPLGDCNPECFPFTNEGGLNAFLKNFHITLNDYLFDDNYSVVIKSKYTDKYNTKFKNKIKRKISKANADFVKLW